MKLLTKTSLVYIIITLLVFGGGTVFFYQSLKSIIKEEADENLTLKKEQLINYISTEKKLPENSPFSDVTTFTEIPKAMPDIIHDTLLYNKTENETLPYRELVFSVMHEGKIYSCAVRKAMFESDDLIETILNTFGIISAILVLVLIGTGIVLSKMLWKPFFVTLTQLREYDTETNNSLKLPETKTTEFRELNETIVLMNDKIQSGIRNLKSFSENASHEIQTPLAIIQNSIENLLQSEALTESQAIQISELNKTVLRLKNLTQTLLLLTKIENNQFTTTDKINFSQLIADKKEYWEELFSLKNIALSIDSGTNIKIVLEPLLAETIVSNLLSNALKYTETGGEATVKLSAECLEISNTGNPVATNPEKLFERFYKGHTRADSTGLGLALVKQIALSNKHRIEYEYKNKRHYFSYYF